MMTMIQNVQQTDVFKVVMMWVGAAVGWVVGEFLPTFPLMVVTLVFILCDALTAYRLDQRVHEKYPDKVSRERAKFTSFAFGKVVKVTIPKRLEVIILAWMAQHWVLRGFMDQPVVYVATGAILLEQTVSILENEFSCRDERSSWLFRMLKGVLIDKTERHFDVDLEELKKPRYDFDDNNNNNNNDNGKGTDSNA